jgi:hypothetical protein
MDRTAATHSQHDELLIVRLFGGDVDAPERARAFDVLDSCKDCAALFADLGATADATAALPVPGRPRDFILSEADAARLRRRRRGIGFLSVLRRTRAIGGSLVAIGLVGVVATASLGILGGTSGTSLTSNRSGAFGYTADTAAGGAAATAGPAALAAVASGSPLPAAAPLEASAPAPLPTQVQDAVGTTGTGSKAVPPAPVQSGLVATGSGAEGSGAGSPDAQALAAATTSTGLDARLVWLGGFGLLFLAGLSVLIAPLIRRRKTR